jgi:hypothetical protein
VDLDKRIDEYLVIVDDRDALTSVAEHSRESRMPVRHVLLVVRQAAHPAERQAQLDELADSCLDAESESLNLLTFTAVSHGHAADLARWEYAVAMAAHGMAEVIDRHLDAGARGWVAGWVAIRIVDGSSDGVLYADAEDARGAQRRLGRCTVFPISPNDRPSVRDCEAHLKAMAHRPHGGCTLLGVPTCY